MKIKNALRDASFNARFLVYRLTRKIRRELVYHQVARPGKIRLSNRSINTVAILLTDLILFAGFALIAGIPMALCGIHPLAILGILIAVWLAMDAAACLARRRRMRKTMNAYLDEWGAYSPEG